jgi:RNA polymerase sigma-70 factor (ECF subfamily)
MTADRHADEFRAFVDDHHEMLFTIALRHCRGCPDPRQDALERVQNALLKVWIKWGRARKRDPLGYTIQAVQNECIDAHRARIADKRPPETLSDPSDLIGHRNGRDDIETLTEQISIRQRLRPIWQRLKPSHREVLERRHLRDQSLAEVAADLGVTEGTIKRLASDARNEARRIHAEEEPR